MANDRNIQVGELRPSQMMYAFGVGAIVDLPHISVIVMGLDDWRPDAGVTRPIHEDRLLRAVRWALGSQVQGMLTPPATPETIGFPNPFDETQRVGVPVATFPRWMVCPQCRLLASLASGLFELRDNPFHPDRTHYVHINCPKSIKPPTVVPARFMVACDDGHLDDFPWTEFVHGGPTQCPAKLQLIEYGPSGETRDVRVRCEVCEQQRPLSDAFGKPGKLSMPRCRGRRPHLRDHEECDLQVKAILLGASNIWFADVLSTLAIPTESARLVQLVADHWGVLRHATNLPGVVLLHQVGQLADLHGYTDEQIWQAIEHKRQQDQAGEQGEPSDLKSPEWEILTQPNTAPQNNDFRLRQDSVPTGFEDLLDKVVLAERLREVRALIGFTRMDAPGELGDTPEAAKQRRMRLTRQPPTWVPASEVRGEGLFIQFAEQAVQRWLARPEVQKRDNEFREAHRRWRQVHRLEPPDAGYPGMRYVLLHSFAHALMRQFALECGYAAASIRERIYAQNGDEPEASAGPMAGVLIYTSAPDSEGTLGGLVSLGAPQELQRHMIGALHDMRLCASDPLCAEHLPSQQAITLHGAACHACLFSPETSCERGNKYLDRSVLGPTVEHADLRFFEGDD